MINFSFRRNQILSAFEPRKKPHPSLTAEVIADISDINIWTIASYFSVEFGLNEGKFPVENL